MIGFTHVFKQNYDKRIKIGGEYVFGYSEKKMRELYPQKNYTVAGEAKSAKPRKKKAEGKPPKKPEQHIGSIGLGGRDHDVFIPGTHKGIFQKRDGYICVAEDTFVAVHSSLLPFICVITATVALIIAVILLAVNLLINPPPPVVVDPPVHPMPDIDPDIETLPADDDEKVVSEGGGGFVSLVYTKEATVSLSENKATIFYQNPNKSNHSVLLEMYVVSEGQEYLLGKTGLIPAGSAIYQIDVTDRDANVRAGIYTGLYRLYYYDPVTGERAAISSDVTDIKVSVNE